MKSTPDPLPSSAEKVSGTVWFTQPPGTPPIEATGPCVPPCT